MKTEAKKKGYARCTILEPQSGGSQNDVIWPTYQRWRLRQWHECELCRAEAKHEPLSTLESLRRLKSNPAVMAQLRLRLAHSGGAHDVSRWKDDVVLERMAREVSRGRWLICRHDDGARRDSQPADTAPAAPAQQTVVPRRQAPPEEPRPTVLDESSSFPGDADLMAIAEAQREAARLGVPFCEECEKAKMAGQRGGNG